MPRPSRRSRIDAYSEVFSNIAAERKDLENRRGVLSTTLSSGARKEKAAKSMLDFTAMVADVRRALASPTVTGSEKRGLIGTIIDKVICRKGGAQVQFKPDLFQCRSTGVFFLIS
jgi:hypothetical protein